MFRPCLAKFGGQCSLLALVFSCLTDPPGLPKGFPWLATDRSPRAAPEPSRPPGLLFSNVRQHFSQMLLVPCLTDKVGPMSVQRSTCVALPHPSLSIPVGEESDAKNDQRAINLHCWLQVTSGMRILALVACRQKSRFPIGIRRHGVEFASFLQKQGPQFRRGSTANIWCTFSSFIGVLTRFRKI